VSEKLSRLFYGRVSDERFKKFYNVDSRLSDATQKSAKDKFDIFADLDPLQKKNMAPASKPSSQPMNFDPLAPVAPPRTKKASTENWTTFE
jgi:hypothetical protein